MNLLVLVKGNSRSNHLTAAYIQTVYPFLPHGFCFILWLVLAEKEGSFTIKELNILIEGNFKKRERLSLSQHPFNLHERL